MSKRNQPIAGYNANYLISRIVPGFLFLITLLFIFTGFSEDKSFYGIISEAIKSPGRVLVSIIFLFILGSIIHRFYIYLYIPPTSIRKFYYKEYNNPEYLTARSKIVKTISIATASVLVCFYLLVDKVILSKEFFPEKVKCKINGGLGSIILILPGVYSSNSRDKKWWETISSVEEKFGVDKDPRKLHSSIMSVLSGRKTKQLNEMRNSLELIYNVYLLAIFMMSYSLFNIISYSSQSNVPVEYFIIVFLVWILLFYFAILVRRYAERSYIERVFDEYNAVMEMEDQD